MASSFISLFEIFLDRSRNGRRGNIMGGRERLRESLIGSHSHPPHYTEHCLAISSETKRKEKKKSPSEIPNTQHKTSQERRLYFNSLSLFRAIFLSLYIYPGMGEYTGRYIYIHIHRYMHISLFYSLCSFVPYLFFS